MFGYLGSVASLGGSTASGNLDIQTIDILSQDGQGTVVATRKTFRLRTGSLAGLKDGVTITVGGTPYKVIKVRLEGDGLETVLDLQG